MLAAHVRQRREGQVRRRGGRAVVPVSAHPFGNGLGTAREHGAAHGAHQGQRAGEPERTAIVARQDAQQDHVGTQHVVAARDGLSPSAGSFVARPRASGGPLAHLVATHQVFEPPRAGHAQPSGRHARRGHVRGGGWILIDPHLHERRRVTHARDLATQSPESTPHGWLGLGLGPYQVHEVGRGDGNGKCTCLARTPLG